MSDANRSERCKRSERLNSVQPGKNRVARRVARRHPQRILTRNLMRFEPNNVYHIYNRGNNKQRIFFSEKNYLFFLQKISKHITPHCEILSWCLMPNHFHFMVYANEESCLENYGTIKLKIQALTYWIGIIQSSYAQAINKQNGTTGSLFQCKTKAKLLSEREDIIRCHHYIHKNPLQANLVNDLKYWQFSSYPDYAGLRTGKLCNQNRLIDLTGFDHAECFNVSGEVADTNLFF